MIKIMIYKYHIFNMLYPYRRYTLTISAIMQKHIARYAMGILPNMLYAKRAICYGRIGQYAFAISPIYFYHIADLSFRYRRFIFIKLGKKNLLIQ